MTQDLDQQVRQAVVDYFRRLPRRYPFFSIVLGILILVLIIWFIPLWQVPGTGLSLKDRLHQINENRKTVAQIVGGVFILVGLYIAWVRSKAMQDQAEVDREQQLTDLYVKAIEQLGNEKLQIRLGGIYALERIARESPKDHWPIMEVLTAFVRENAPRKEEAEREMQEAPKVVKKVLNIPLPEKPPTDIQAVLTVLGRTAIAFSQEGEERSLDLQTTHLVGADLQQGNIQRVNFFGANLQGVILEGADLQRADLSLAYIQQAELSEANLQRADLLKANLKGTYLIDANLKETRLQGANLRGALLDGANLQGADLLGANLHEADLRSADLRGTKGLTAEQVAAAIWDERTQWPEWFSPPLPLKEKDEEEK